MQIWIALLRGINVGGKNKLPMAELKAELEKINLEDIKTYIQSGNVVFRGPKTNPSDLSRKIGDTLFSSHGFSPGVFVLTRDQLRVAIKANPFPVTRDEGNRLHFYFLSKTPPRLNEEAINSIKLESEKWKLVDDVFYFYAPDGFGRSKLAANAERLLGVSATVRNWRTVGKILELTTS